MTTVQMIGLGVVGTDQAFLCQKLGIEVFGYAVRPSKTHQRYQARARIGGCEVALE